MPKIKVKKKFSLFPVDFTDLQVTKRIEDKMKEITTKLQYLIKTM